MSRQKKGARTIRLRLAAEAARHHNSSEPEHGTGQSFSEAELGRAAGLEMPAVTGRAAGLEMPAAIGRAAGLEVPAVISRAAGLEMPVVVGRAAGLEVPAVISRAAGLDMPAAIGRAAGLEMPAVISRAAGLEMPAVIGRAAGFEMPAAIGCAAGLEMPAAIGCAAGLEMPAAISRAAGHEMPTVIGRAAGLEMPAAIGCAAGLEMPAAISRAAGLEMPAVISRAAGLEMPAVISRAAGLEMPAAIGCAAGLDMPAAIGRAAGLEMPAVFGGKPLQLRRAQLLSELAQVLKPPVPVCPSNSPHAPLLEPGMPRDVGSWVREAAMRGLEQCAYLLAEDGRSSAPSDGDGASSPGTLGAGLAQSVVAVLVKQAVEKIDRVRDVAGSTLSRLLHSPQRLCTEDFPGRTLLEEAIPAEGPLGVPGETFSRFALLLRCQECRTALVQGLVISIGGIDSVLGRAASSALFPLLRAEPEGPEILVGMLRPLLATLEANAKNDRVVLPLLRTIDQLFQSGVLCTERDPYTGFFSELLELVRGELRQCRDIAKLLEGVAVVCHFVGSGQGEVPSQALQSILALMVNRYPKVRKYAAEQLYVRLLTAQDDEEDEARAEKLEEVVDLLGETPWDAPVPEVKVNRNKLYAPLGLTPPAAATSMQMSKKAAVEPVDENASYAALVESAGY
ncbi:hypothetical protein CYMTET_31433 [Cymbomonas tetramitiformis]|uniref:Tubulin-folding cofactor D C-terminal domain-containing protein n=1 Tax=Cymbomonas tetramitiformis TaxID=36881 RepID=A0AAE0KSX0_9CHLO|nr:hypothetical protein CYMTET_31433 [Cymbomonas tetramitiformis]